MMRRCARHHVRLVSVEEITTCYSSRKGTAATKAGNDKRVEVIGFHGVRGSAIVSIKQKNSLSVLDLYKMTGELRYA
jgi:hypothetical protein